MGLRKVDADLWLLAGPVAFAYGRFRPTMMSPKRADMAPNSSGYLVPKPVHKASHMVSGAIVCAAVGTCASWAHPSDVAMQIRALGVPVNTHQSKTFVDTFPRLALCKQVGPL